MDNVALLPLSSRQVACFLDGIYGTAQFKVTREPAAAAQDLWIFGQYRVQRLKMTLKLPLFAPTDLFLFFCLPTKEIIWCEVPQKGRKA